MAGNSRPVAAGTLCRPSHWLYSGAVVAGTVKRPVGPYAEGPTAAALVVERPVLVKFGVAEFARTIVMGTVLGWTLGRRLA